MDVLYHITTQKTALKILKEGILPNKKQIWRKKIFGKFEKGFIYAFEDFLDAVRWACKTDWDLNESDPASPKEPIVILRFIAPYSELWLDDNHVESMGYRKKWRKCKAPVPADDLLMMITEACWRKEVRKVTAKDYLIRTDTIIL